MTFFPDRFQTKRLTLCPIAPEDAIPIFDTYAQDTEVTRYLTWRPHGSIADTEVYIASCLATPPDCARIYVLVGGGGVMGALDVRRTAPHRLEFGYVLARRFWGRGLMTEALTEVVRWAERQPGIFRVGSVCDVDNIGSARVMEKAGLTREGLARRWLMHPNFGDEPRDCYCYARAW